MHSFPCILLNKYTQTNHVPAQILNSFNCVLVKLGFKFTI